MALASYSDLQGAVANWLARSGDATLTPVILDFITLAEQRLNRDLRLRAMETRDAAFAIASSYTALPGGFVELRAIRLNTLPATPLRLVAPEWIDSSYAGSQAGRPRVFSVLADQLRVAPAPDAAYTADLTYYKKLTALSAGQPTNWLLANAPDLYLYASLVEAVGFIGNDERLTVWNGAYERARAALQSADDRGTWGGPGALVRSDGGNP